MAANLKSVRTLCHGCLSADRDLSPIGEFTDMFTMICDRKARVPGLKYTSLCWECTATLKRMQLFHKQVNNAQTILKFYVRTKDLQKPVPKSLSRLKSTITSHDFISFIEPDEPEPNVILLHEIKEDVDQDESEVYKLELKHDEDENVVNTDIFDADDDFTYSDDIKSEESTLIKKQKSDAIVNKKKSSTKDTSEEWRPKVHSRYSRISTPEKMCVKEQARPSDLANLWEQDGCIVQGSHATQNSSDQNAHNPHVCNACHTRYPTLEELNSHVKSHSIYRCLMCGHRSPSMEAAGQHVIEHGEIIKCSFCEYCCRFYRNYPGHYKLAHTQFWCDYCGKKFKSKRKLEMHISVHHVRSFKCKECQRTYTAKRSLKAHIAYAHDVCETEDTFCVECNLQCKNRARFNLHLKSTIAHSPQRIKRIKCLDAGCERIFRQRSFMMNHYKNVHLGQPQYYCSICDKRYCKLETYDMHRRHKHEGVPQKRDKICSVCGRGFTQKTILVNHMRTHTGERPFACAVCDARFAQRTARNMHQKRHCRQNKAN